MNPQLPNLISAIRNNKKFEMDELFNHIVTQKAIDRLKEFKVETAKQFFNKGNQK